MVLTPHKYVPIIRGEAGTDITTGIDEIGDGQLDMEFESIDDEEEVAVGGDEDIGTIRTEGDGGPTGMGQGEGDLL